MNPKHWIRKAALFGCLSILIAAPSAARAHDDLSILARQGLMAAMQLDANVLYAMAKGEAAYDAEIAAERAANLKRLAGYDMRTLFTDGTSVAKKPGETRALEAIWAEPGKFEEGFVALRSAVDAVDLQAAAGSEQLRAAVVEMGKICGGCHKAYRAKETH